MFLQSAPRKHGACRRSFSSGSRELAFAQALRQVTRLSSKINMHAFLGWEGERLASRLFRLN